MKLVDQWHAMEADFPADWEDVRLTLTAEQPSDLPRAAQVLGSINVGRVGDDARLPCPKQRRPAGQADGVAPVRAPRSRPDLVPHRAVERADVCCADARAEAAEALRPTGSVAESWDRALAPLPSDWTDLLCELEIESSTLLARAALLCAPLNPARSGSAPRLHVPLLRSLGLRRLARRWRGDASSASTTRASSARRRVLRVLSDTDNVDTQGPVWLVGGKTL